jgi:hypothetical protein
VISRALRREVAARTAVERVRQHAPVNEPGDGDRRSIDH